MMETEKLYSQCFSLINKNKTCSQARASSILERTCSLDFGEEGKAHIQSNKS